MGFSEFKPRKEGRSNCDDKGHFGRPSGRFDYIMKNTSGDDDYPVEACEPWYHSAFQVDSIQLNTSLSGSGSVTVDGSVSSNGGTHVLSNKKNLPFDMPHPNKEGWRLRHVCIEGPEIAVYCRGTVPPDGIINLPSFWEGLVNPEDISINITPIGCWQELFVKEIKWGRQIIVRNNAGGPINAHYHIVARRLDDDLVVEYEGTSHEDYPNGNEGYSFNYEHNYVENLIKETVREEVRKLAQAPLTQETD